MIIVKLQGGLGNQLFQYALGRNLALKNKSRLRLDISGFRHDPRDPLREYSLDVFTIPAGIINGIASTCVKLVNRSVPLANFFGLNYQYIREKKLREDKLRENKPGFLPEMLEKRGNLYLEGYWQSEKYFKEIRGTILTDLTLQSPLDTVNLRMIEKIKESNAVCLHVSRGDYNDNETHNEVIDNDADNSDNEATNSIHGTCSLEYYHTCISLVKEKVTMPTFFIFSDDHAWVKENLRIDAPCVYVDINKPEEGYKDLELMSYCKHFIIANSSFSWWGAWLSQHEKKLVYAPKRWFVNSEILPVDIIPEEWKSI